MGKGQAQDCSVYKTNNTPCLPAPLILISGSTLCTGCCICPPSWEILHGWIFPQICNQHINSWEGGVFPLFCLKNLEKISGITFRVSESPEEWLKSSIICFNAHLSKKNRPSNVNHPSLAFQILMLFINIHVIPTSRIKFQLT